MSNNKNGNKKREITKYEINSLILTRLTFKSISWVYIYSIVANRNLEKKLIVFD